MVDTYQQEYEILRRTFDLILNAPDFELRPIRIDLESSESRLRVGISLGPAEKITQVCKSNGMVLISRILLRTSVWLALSLEYRSL